MGVEGGQKTRGVITKHMPLSCFWHQLHIFRWAAQRINRIFDWLRSLLSCRGPWGLLYFPDGRPPWHATSSVQSPGPKTSAPAVEMSKHFNPNAPFKMAQDVSLIQHFHKRFGQWHLWKVKRLLFMTICADCGYGISRYTLNVHLKLYATFFIPSYVFMQHILKAYMPGT